MRCCALQIAFKQVLLVCSNLRKERHDRQEAATFQRTSRLLFQRSKDAWRIEAVVTLTKESGFLRCLQTQQCVIAAFTGKEQSLKAPSCAVQTVGTLASVTAKQ